MYWEKRKDRYGNIYYSFLQWDHETRRNIRLKKELVPADIQTDRQAEDFCRVREADFSATKFRIEQKLQWQKAFYNFEDLLAIFKEECKRRAPNSYETVIYFLRQYVFDFYLNQKKSNNINNWSMHFEEFRSWLLIAKPSKRNKTCILAYGTKNNIIGALNLFLEIMNTKGKCAPPNKCSKFSKSLLNTRNADHVIDKSEAMLVFSCLQELDSTQLASHFFWVLLNTGLRLSEGLSLSLNDFFPGVPDNRILRGALGRHNLVPYGYISLESQLKNSLKPRTSTYTVERKPLKGRKKIDARSSRIIPVLDKKCFNILALRYNEQSDLLSKETFGKDKSDYLLFNGLDKNRFSRLLREAYAKAKKTHKSPHCCRHTFATNFAGISNGDTGLCRLVLGHKDEDTTLGYIHLYEQINRQSRATELSKSKIDLIM